MTAVCALGHPGCLYIGDAPHKPGPGTVLGAPWTCKRCGTRVAAHLPHSCEGTTASGTPLLSEDRVRELAQTWPGAQAEDVYDKHFRDALLHRIQALESALNGANIRETASLEVRRLLGSPHAFTALADRVVALEGRLEETHPYASFIRDVVREEMEEVIERALGSLLQGLLAGKFPQYREADPLDG